MSYVGLARKYRSQTFDDLLGQPHIVTALKRALLTNSLAQAYLFCGTRGVGKTSVARILAKAVRCQKRILSKSHNPCLTCPQCLEVQNDSSLDVLEIDGASHNGVEQIRDLIDRAHFLPSSGDHKIFIIDEVHMLSTSAFNALLKTLEDPPRHLIFILATTDPEKLLDTVISRCQRMDFKNASINELQRNLSIVLEKEHIEVESTQVLSELAHAAKGSFRDGLTLLDQALMQREGNRLMEKEVAKALGFARPSQVLLLFNAILKEDLEILKKVYLEIAEENIQLAHLVERVLDLCFQEIEKNASADADPDSLSQLIWLYEQLCRESIWVLKSISPAQALFVLFKKLTQRNRLMGLPSQAPAKVANPLTFDQFFKHLEKVRPLMATNFSQGKIASDSFCNRQGKYHLKLIFENKNKVFFDYFMGPSTRERLAQEACAFFSIERVELFQFEVVLSQEKIENIAATQEIEQKELTQKKINELRNHALIREAQSLFQAEDIKVEINP